MYSIYVFGQVVLVKLASKKASNRAAIGATFACLLLRWEEVTKRAPRLAPLW